MARNYKELQAKVDPASLADNKQRVREELQRMAPKKLRGSKQLTLRDEGREVFVNAILDPPAPNKAARMAAAGYKKDMGR
jgi:hypothetical protein